MRHAAPPLLLLLLAALVAAQTHNDTDVAPDSSAELDTVADQTNNDTVEDKSANNDTLSDFGDAGNDTLIETDGDHAEVVRKKRTFGDIVFRGLADVLGYNVQRKPPAAFPPPLAPVPGIDAPLQAAATAAPAVAAPAPAAAPPPCGAPRAAGPPPCRAQRPPPPPPKPRPPPPCPKPRAAPRPKPRPPPPPPPPPPCAKPRANPTTPSPCAPAPPPPPPPPPAKADNLETISSNFRLNFNFNRSPVTAAPAAPAADEEEAEQEPEQEQAALEPLVPIAIRPQAAKLPQSEPRKPRVYVDAFLVRNGIAQRVDTLDANQFDPQRATADEDYNTYDDNSEQQLDDDYEDVQESRDRAKAVAEFGTAVDRFWEKKKQQRKPRPQRLPENHYQNVHFGDRDAGGQIRLQSLQRERPQLNRIPEPQPDAEDDSEVTTTTEDPKKSLRPRVLPPTEHNPNQIDTVTVRVPPIYKEKRPKKFRGPSESGERESEESYYNTDYNVNNYDNDTNGEDSWLAPRTEPPTKRKRKRRKNRKTRSADDYDPYSAGDYDYYGRKIPVSDEEKLYMQLTIPPPTKDADLELHEGKTPEEEQFLDDHERLREDPERIKKRKKNRDSERADSSERSGESERSTEDKEREGDQGRADEHERSDKLSPNAQVQETQYQNKYVHAHNVQVEDPRPRPHLNPRSSPRQAKP